MDEWTRDLERILAEHDRPPADANVQLANLRTGLSMLTSAGAELARALERRTQQHQAATTRLAEASLLVDSLLDKTQALGEERERMLMELALRDAELDSVCGDITRLQTEVASLAEANTGLEAQLDAAQADFQDLLARFDRLAVDLEASQARADGLQRELDAALERLAGLDADLQASRARADAVQGELDAALARLAGLEADLQASQARADGVQGELDGALGRVGDLEAELQVRRGELADLDDRLSALSGELRRIGPDGGMEEAAAEADIPGDGVASGVAVLAAAVAAAVAHGRRKDAGLSEAATRAESSEARAAALQAQLDELSARLDGLQAELQTAESVRSQSEQQMVAAEARLAGLRQESDLRAEAMAAQISGLQAEHDAALATISNLEMSVRLADTQVVDLRSQLATLRGQLRTARGERDTAQERLRARDAELAELQSRLAASEPLRHAVSVAEALHDLPETKRGTVSTAIIAGVQPRLSNRLQELTRVKGVGPTLQSRLYGAGVGSYWELACLSDDELRRILDMSDALLRGVDLNEMRSGAFRLARDTDSVGQIWNGRQVDDFEPVAGIGKKFEQRLYAAGICTYDQLANATVEQLAEIGQVSGSLTPNYARWIAQARQLADERRTSRK